MIIEVKEETQAPIILWINLILLYIICVCVRAMDT